MRMTALLLFCGFVLAVSGCTSPAYDSAARATVPRPGPAVAASEPGGWPAGTQPGDDQPALYHETRAGETLSDISLTYGVSVPRLLQVNGLDAGDGLKPGQLIYIPNSR